MNAPFEYPRIKSKLRKMGNSTGLIVPKPILDQLGLASGAEVEWRVENGEVIARPAKRKVREGWEEAAKEIAAAGMTEEERDWLEFDDPIPDEGPVPPEWLAADWPET
jgi:antitoxin MazE